MATIDVKDAAGATVAIEKPLAPGSAAAASSRPVAFSTEDIARLGIITETAPATDTASSGLNGRLQRIAQRLTSLIALLPASLGSKADAASLAVTLSTEDKALLDTVETKLAAIQAAAEDVTTPVNSVGYIAHIAVTPTVEATPDYSTGDVIGGKMTFSAITRADTKTAYVTAIRIYSKSDITVPIDVLFFNADPSATTWTENSAIAFNDTDATKLLGCAQVSQWFDLGTPVVGFNGTCRIPIVGNAADDIYVVMVARGTINLGSTSDLIVEITVDQN